MYVVLRLNTDISVKDIFDNEHNINVAKGGVAGYLPVYHTLEEAAENNGNGKYKIVQIVEEK